jgi:Zn-dependent M16 (insulinase) family peptidase
VVECGDNLAQMICGSDMVTEKQQCQELDSWELRGLSHYRIGLWDKVRVQGGAYGGFCTLDHRSGNFTFLSYRDPNLLETLDIYDQTPAFLKRAEPDESELTRSIIGTIGDIDTYQLPDAKGFTSMQRYLAGESDDIRQRRRDEILGASIADFRAFADALAELTARGQVVVLGSEQAIQAANARRSGFLHVAEVV